MGKDDFIFNVFHYQDQLSNYFNRSINFEGRIHIWQQVFFSFVMQWTVAVFKFSIFLYRKDVKVYF